MNEYKFNYEVKVEPNANAFASLSNIPHDFEPVEIAEHYELYELHTAVDVQTMLDQTDAVIEYREI